MQDGVDSDVLWLEFREAMAVSIVIVTCCGVVVSNEIDRLMWTTTIEERLNKNTIIELHTETILRLVKIDGVLHRDLPDDEEKNENSHEQVHRLPLKIHSRQ